MACGKPPEHDADHGEADERSDGGGVAFEVARQTAVAADPCERPLDDPAFWQNLKSGNVRSPDDLQAPSTGAPNGQCHLASGISAISKNVFDEREQSSGSAQQMESTITILNVGRMNDDIQQEAQRVQAAIACVRKALLVAPDYIDATFNLALLLQRNGAFTEAADYWRRYLARDRASEWAMRARRSLKFCEIQVNSVACSAGSHADSD